MARIRSIKPEFFTDEAVGECSPSARLLFVASWVFADDHGNLDRSAKQLKAQAFPYDAIDCEPLIQELIKVGLLVEYEVSGKKYLHIKGFVEHQKIDKPSKPRVPIYDHSTNTRRDFDEYSGSTRPGKERKGVESSRMESNGEEGKGISTHTHGARDEQGAETQSEALREITGAAALAVPLRKAGVRVTSMHPLCIGWANDGYTVEQALQAVAVARENIPEPEPIPAKYLDKVLRNPPRPSGNGKGRPNGNGHARGPSYASVMAALDAATDWSQPEFPEDEADTGASP